MDNQQGQGGGGPQWGRPEQSIGAIVDDRSQAVWAKGLGWVRPDGALRFRGHDYSPDQVPEPLRPEVMQWAEKARRVFAPGAAQQMAQATAQATAPKPPAMGGGGAGSPSTPSLPANPTHHALVSSFKHLANRLTQGPALGGN